MIYYLISVISLILYVLAPKEYSYTFNVLILAIYILDFILFVKRENIKALSYSTLFFLFFFLVNFAYPIFIYPFDPNFILQFRYSFSVDYINSGSALSLLAFTMFVCGYAQKEKRKIVANTECLILSKTNYRLFSFLSSLVFLYNLRLIIPQIGINYQDAQVPFQSGSLFVMLECALCLLRCYEVRSEILGNTKYFFYSLRYHIIISSIFALSCLLLGSREFVLTLSLLFVFLYSFYVKPIKPVKMIIGLFLGIAAFYFISQVRNNTHITDSKQLFEQKSWQNGQVNGAWNLATDMIINNRNLYVGMQYVDDPKHGYTYGYNYIPNMLSPIPFLPSLFTQYILGTTVVNLTSQQILTNYTRDDLGEKTLDYELGSNCVADVYMAFGVVGVIVLFYYLGIFVRYLEDRMESNVKVVCVYLLLFTGVIFFCRGSFFGPIKNVVWAYWVCCLCLKSTIRQQS